ncbi:MAG: ABC transporter substrate-binding protein, partial [Oscillospiraceae bacterium]|nr:ABC transporter substrate-binding protein [Oscillospiraceae bacterium]
MKKLLAMALALCMVFALCACGQSTAPAAAPAASEAPAASAEPERTSFIMGIDPEYPPFSYLGDDGNYTGFDV